MYWNSIFERNYCEYCRVFENMMSSWWFAVDRVSYDKQPEPRGTANSLNLTMIIFDWVETQSWLRHSLWKILPIFHVIFVNTRLLFLLNRTFENVLCDVCRIKLTMNISKLTQFPWMSIVKEITFTFDRIS